MTDLKPCPFCGCADTITSSNGEGSEFIGCMECGAEGPPGRSPEDAADRWNTRAAAAMPGDDGGVR